MILHLRVDERLAHGQVCLSWLKFLSATHLLVINDEVAADNFQKQVMSLGIPNDVKSLFATVDKGIEILNNPKSATLKIYPIVKTPADAIKVLNAVEGIKEVVFGAFGAIVPQDKVTSIKICQGMSLDAENVAFVKEIQKKVKEVYFQETPNYKKFLFNF